MYKIIGADLKEYGPITADQLRQWISEGRVNSETKVQKEGALDWKRVADLPEFAMAVAPAAPPVSAHAPAIPAPVAMTPVKATTNQTAVWAMITGIISFIPCCWGILGVVSLILGCVALAQLKKNPQQTGSGFAIAGIVMGIISLLLALVVTILFATSPQLLTNLQNGLNQ